MLPSDILRLPAFQEQADLDLHNARCALCDLLVGRSFRLYAAVQLAAALDLEVGGLREAAIDFLERAAHMEWMATISERGEVRWGGRMNRCGYQASEETK